MISGCRAQEFEREDAPAGGAVRRLGLSGQLFNRPALPRA